MCDNTACEYGALVGGECGPSAKYPSSKYVRIVECNRSIERHFTDTLQASFANCGLNTEAELILARAGKYETCFFNPTLSCTVMLCTHASSCTIVELSLIKIKRFTYFLKLIYQ